MSPNQHKPCQLILILHTSPFASHPQNRREGRPLAPMGHHEQASGNPTLEWMHLAVKEAGNGLNG